jgi:hypothetical protein
MKFFGRHLHILPTLDARLRNSTATFNAILQAMIAFVHDHRTTHGVESICKVLPIAPTTYYARLAVRADPALASPRCQRDIDLKPKIKKVWDDNY